MAHLQGHPPTDGARSFHTLQLCSRNMEGQSRDPARLVFGKCEGSPAQGRAWEPELCCVLHVVVIGSPCVNIHRTGQAWWCPPATPALEEADARGWQLLAQPA